VIVVVRREDGLGERIGIGKPVFEGIVDDRPVVSPDETLVIDSEVLLDGLVGPRDLAVLVEDTDADICFVDDARDRIVRFHRRCERLLSALFLGTVAGDADGAPERAVFQKEVDPQFVGYRVAVDSSDGDIERRDVVLVGCADLARNLAFDAFDIAIGEHERDVLAEEFVARIAGRLDDDVVDRDEASVGIDLVNAVVDRVDERPIPVERNVVVGIPRMPRRPRPLEYSWISDSR